MSSFDMSPGYFCKICGNNYTKKNSWLSHMKDKHDPGVKKLLRCDGCSYQTRRVRDLQRHKLSCSRRKQLGLNPPLQSSYTIPKTSKPRCVRSKYADQTSTGTVSATTTLISIKSLQHHFQDQVQNSAKRHRLLRPHHYLNQQHQSQSCHQHQRLQQNQSSTSMTSMICSLNLEVEMKHCTTFWTVLLHP